MIVLDTHTWIWWVTDSPKLSNTAIKLINDSDSCGVSIISCWETAMLVAKQRIGFNKDIQDWIEQALQRPKTILLKLDPKITVLSTRLPGDFHSDPADRFIVATCLALGVPLITKDKRISQYSFIQTFW